LATSTPDLSEVVHFANQFTQQVTQVLRRNEVGISVRGLTVARDAAKACALLVKGWFRGSD
jgi:hypothetical protein